MSTVKNILSISAITGCLLLGLSSCNRAKFAALNTNPDGVDAIDPKTELTTGQESMVNNDFEVFYDFVRAIKPWTQWYVPMAGNSGTFLQSPGNIGNRWSTFYGSVGPNLMDVMELTKKGGEYTYLNAIAQVCMAYYAFYTTDGFDRMPYSQAFQARYTNLLTPVYDAQLAIYDSIDTQLKNAVAILESTPATAQEAVGSNDLFYGGNATEWAKAGNALRLKLAMRWMKQDPAMTTAIANEVLADNVGMMTSTADDWILYSTTIGTGGNSNPVNQTIYAGAHNTIAFMTKTGDPRERIFYLPAGISTEDMFDSAKAQGQLPDTLTWDGQTYRGQYVSPAATADPTRSYWFQKLTFSYQGIQTSVYYPSEIQPGLTYYTYNATTGGINMFPIITYADVCLMRAELKQRGLDNDPMTAQALYTAGVTASIQNYFTWGQNTLEPGFTALGSNEIANYLAAPGVAFDPANALEQICVQEYLNYYVVPNESWAVEKRTGYPSTTGNILQWEDVSAYGAMPRRYVINPPSLTDLNYVNEEAAIDSMEAEPNFGQINDITGRVWWDQPL